MGLSAQDVHDKQFKLVRQSTGYDIDEVDAFLDEVEAEIARLTAELELARAAAAAAVPVGPVDSAPNDGEPAFDVPAPDLPAAERPADHGAGAAARILELAQRTADEYLDEARRTAESLIAEAQTEAQTAATAAVQGLEAQRADLEARVSALRTFESEIRARLTSFFESQLNDLRAIGEPAPAGDQ